MAPESHDRFWKRLVGLESGIGKPGAQGDGGGIGGVKEGLR